jgi:hypothetical protein
MDGNIQYQLFGTDDNGAHAYVQLYRSLAESGGTIFEEVPWGANGHLVIYSLPQGGKADDALQMVPEEMDGKVANSFTAPIQPVGGGEL